jgi:hypothetical protein
MKSYRQIVIHATTHSGNEVTPEYKVKTLFLNSEYVVSIESNVSLKAYSGNVSRIITSTNQIYYVEGESNE